LLVERHMFGGLALYFKGRMVAVLMENPDDPDWNGVLLPTSREHHASLQSALTSPKLTDRQDSALQPAPQASKPDNPSTFDGGGAGGLELHPILPKWLYVRSSQPNLDAIMDRWNRLVLRSDPRVGIEPKPKAAGRRGARKRPSTARSRKRG
jgi:hypothetical protein